MSHTHRMLKDFTNSSFTERCVCKIRADGGDFGFNSSASSGSINSDDLEMITAGYVNTVQIQSTSTVSLSRFSPIESEDVHVDILHPQSSTPDSSSENKKSTLKQSMKTLKKYTFHKQQSSRHLSKLTHKQIHRRQSSRTDSTKNTTTNDTIRPITEMSPQSIFITDPYTAHGSRNYLGFKPMACGISTSTISSTDSSMFDDSSIQLDSKYYTIDDRSLIRTPCLGKDASIVRSSRIDLYNQSDFLFDQNNMSNISDNTIFMEQEICRSPVTKNGFKYRRPSLLKRLKKFGKKRNVPTSQR